MPLLPATPAPMCRRVRVRVVAPVRWRLAGAMDIKDFHYAIAQRIPISELGGMTIPAIDASRYLIKAWYKKLLLFLVDATRAHSYRTSWSRPVRLTAVVAQPLAPPTLRLLDLTDDLLDYVATMLPPHNWRSFASASKAAKVVAGRVVGDVVNAEVSRRLVAGQQVGNNLCARWPALEVRAGTTIDIQAFHGCSSLTGLTLLGSVTTIGYAAFCGCTSLTSLTLPGSLTTIDDYAFRSCSSLTSLTLPRNVTSVGRCAFRGCTLDAESRAAVASIDPDGLWFPSHTERARARTPMRGPYT